MRFLVDASLPRSAAGTLRELGHETADYSGIVVLDLPNHATAAQVVKTLEMFARAKDWLDLLCGRLAIVEASRVRLRPAP